MSRRKPGHRQDVGHAAFDDPTRQALGDRGLADTGLADQQRGCSCADGKGLDDALDFLLAADQRIDLAQQPAG